MKKLFIVSLSVMLAVIACNNNETASKTNTDSTATRPLLTTPPDSLAPVSDTLNKN